jgi:hypothetical protein
MQSKRCCFLKDRPYEISSSAADKPCGHASGVEPPAAAGGPIWIDDQARIAHVKGMMIHGENT